MRLRRSGHRPAARSRPFAFSSLPALLTSPVENPPSSIGFCDCPSPFSRFSYHGVLSRSSSRHLLVEPRHSVKLIQCLVGCYRSSPFQPSSLPTPKKFSKQTSWISRCSCHARHSVLPLQRTARRTRGAPHRTARPDGTSAVPLRETIPPRASPARSAAASPASSFSKRIRTAPLSPSVSCVAIVCAVFIY